MTEQEFKILLSEIEYTVQTETLTDTQKVTKIKALFSTAVFERTGILRDIINEKFDKLCKDYDELLVEEDPNVRLRWAVSFVTKAKDAKSKAFQLEQHEICCRLDDMLKVVFKTCLGVPTF